MKLRSHTISDWASALYLAAYYDRLGVVDLLVEHGVALDPHVLHWAAEGDSKDVVEFLIQSGVNLDQVTDPFWRQGETALHIAARRDNSAIAETLLNHHARTDIRLVTCKLSCIGLGSRSSRFSSVENLSTVN